MCKTDVVCIREIQKSLNQSVKKLLTEKIEKMGLSKLFTISETKIVCNNGSNIIFMGMQNHTADSIKSLEGYDIAWVEEAQSLSQTSLDLLRPTIRKNDSEILFSWNPRSNKDAVDAFFRTENPPKNAIIVKVNYIDNPWLPEPSKEEIEYDKKRDIDKYLHVWEGEYLSASETRVFKNWTVDEFEAPEDAVFRFGADWGYSIDPTVMVRCYTVGKKLYIDYEAYALNCEIVNTPALFLSIPEAEKWPSVADSSRPETISHLRKNGFPKMMPAVKGPKSVEEGVEWLKSYDIIVHPRCKHTIDELTMYSYKTDSKTGQIIPVLEDKDNHVIDALRYACENVRRVHAASNNDHVTIPQKMSYYK
jgi:phage terminase large subunit